MQWQWSATDLDAFEEGGIGTFAAECQTLKFMPPWEEGGLTLVCDKYRNLIQYAYLFGQYPILTPKNFPKNSIQLFKMIHQIDILLFLYIDYFDNAMIIEQE